MVNNLSTSVGDVGSVPGSGRSSGVVMANPLQYSTPVFLPGKFHGRGAWRATVHGVAKSQTSLSDHTHTHRSLPLLDIIHCRLCH